MTRDIFIQACLQFLNKPYKWGGDDPMQGYDCSGLVQDLLAMMGLDPAGDQTAQALYEYFKDKSREGPRDTGALVFFGASPTKLTHVGMIIDGMSMIEAGGGGSKTNTLQDAENQNAFIRIRPITNRRDLQCVLMPKGFPWA